VSRHSRPPGRHRAHKPPSNKAPAVLASAVIGATAAALSTAAASSNGGLRVLAADVTALKAPVPEHVIGVGGPEPIPVAVPAEEPMSGHQLLSAAAAQSRLADIRATRQAKRRQIALIEAARPKWVNPMRPGSYTISSCFCPRWGSFHYGEDMAAPWGTPFYAAGDGIVIHAGPMSGYGNAIMIQHSNGDVTVYGHEEKVIVQVGERVKAGQLIGLVGSLGNSTGPHLHFEVRVGGENGEKVDPVPWMADRGVPIA
jgi:murein DD-endopeptidase MepM/ murein hydrolase activator NlpD